MGRDYLMEPFEEGSTPTFGTTLVDAEGTAIAGSQLLGVWLTLYDEVSLAIINGWQRVPVLNLEGITIDEQGQLRWTLQPADMILLQAYGDPQAHVILLEVQWMSAGIRHVLYDETVILVRNVEKLHALGMGEALVVAEAVDATVT